YFPDPDLLPLVVSDVDLERVRATLPELPDARRARFLAQYGLGEYDAAVLTGSRSAADYFETLLRDSGADPKLCANWQSGELAAALNRAGIEIDASPLPAPALAALLRR